MYDGLNALIGAKVIAVDDDHVYFDNGLRLTSEDIGNYLEIVKADE